MSIEHRTSSIVDGDTAIARVLKAIYQPSRKPDKQAHARKMTSLWWYRTKQVTGKGGYAPDCEPRCP